MRRVDRRGAVRPAEFGSCSWFTAFLKQGSRGFWDLLFGVVVRFRGGILGYIISGFWRLLGHRVVSGTSVAGRCRLLLGAGEFLGQLVGRGRLLGSLGVVVAKLRRNQPGG